MFFGGFAEGDKGFVWRFSGMGWDGVGGWMCSGVGGWGYTEDRW